MINVKNVMNDPAHKQKVMDDTKQMMQDALQQYKADSNSKFGHVAGVTLISASQV